MKKLISFLWLLGITSSLCIAQIDPSLYSLSGEHKCDTITPFMQGIENDFEGLYNPLSLDAYGTFIGYKSSYTLFGVNAIVFKLDNKCYTDFAYIFNKKDEDIEQKFQEIQDELIKCLGDGQWLKTAENNHEVEYINGNRIIKVIIESNPFDEETTIVALRFMSKSTPQTSNTPDNNDYSELSPENIEDHAKEIVAEYLYQETLKNLETENENYGKCISGNCYDGYGVFEFNDGGRYEGNWKNGEFQGQGKYTMADKCVFDGFFKNGEPTNITYTDNRGYKYVGTCKNWEMNGFGTFYYPEKGKYVGEFKNGEMHGKGTMYDADGNIVKHGLWENGQFIGERWSVSGNR